MKKINVDTLAELPGFSHIVSVPADASLLLFSGQTALDENYQVQGGDSIIEQARFALENIKIALAGIDANSSHVAKLKCYVKGMDTNVAMELPELIKAEGIDGCALTIIGVSFIGIEGCLIEIEATVVK